MPSSLDGISVYVACPTTRDFSVATLLSFLNTQEAAFQNGLKIDFVFITGSLPHHARSIAVNKFLESDFNRLFFIDSDIVWTPEEFFSLVIHSLKRDCVVGIYPRKADQLGYFVRFPKQHSELNDEGLMQIDGTGLGFACIQRRVIEDLVEEAPLRLVSGKKQKSLFRMDHYNGEERGEDYAFWADVLRHGFKIWADVTVTVGHVGPKVYRTTVKENNDGSSSQPPHK